MICPLCGIDHLQIPLQIKARKEREADHARRRREFRARVMANAVERQGR